MNQPKISVIVPVYNAEKWLRRCVDSILAQTYTDFELLLVDDGSTDGSGAICDEYATLDPRIRPFHKPNGGVSSARNLGLDNANGEWICFIDSDDEINNLQVLYTTDWDSDMIFFTLKIINKNGTYYSEIPKLTSESSDTKENYIRSYLHLHIFNSVCAKLIRRSIIKNLRFNKTIKFGEDALFNLQLIESVNKITLCNNVEYIYHRNEDYGVKYVGSLENSISTMEQIFAAYHKLGIRNQTFERNVFNCYRTICHEEWTKKPSLWNDNRIVKSVYRNIKKAYPLCFRIKYRLANTSIYHIHRFLKKSN